MDVNERGGIRDVVPATSSPSSLAIWSSALVLDPSRTIRAFSFRFVHKGLGKRSGWAVATSPWNTTSTTPPSTRAQRHRGWHESRQRGYGAGLAPQRHKLVIARWRRTRPPSYAAISPRSAFVGGRDRALPGSAFAS